MAAKPHSLAGDTGSANSPGSFPTQSASNSHGASTGTTSSSPTAAKGEASNAPRRASFTPQSESSQSSTVALNAAFMWEVKSVNEELWQVVELLETIFKRPHLIAGRSRKLIRLLEQLLDLVGMQFTLEEAYGYFDDPEYVEPAVSSEAVKLRDEHATLYASLMKLVERTQDFFFEHDENGLIYKVPSQFHAFMEQFHEHDQRECALTLTSMNQDLGVGD